MGVTGEMLKTAISFEQQIM